MRRACSTVWRRMASACCAQRADGGSRIMSARLGQESRHFLLEQQPRTAGGHFALAGGSRRRAVADRRWKTGRRLEISPPPGSMSRGTAKSTMKIGRWRRARTAAAAALLVIERRGARRAAHDDVGLGQFLVEALKSTA